jgi:2-methylcitrate dehydratase PrpD
LGRFGAAIGVAKLLSLDIDGISRAMGLAATQAAGLRETFGTMCKPFHPGKAAMDGVMSALLSSRGFSAPVAILEGKAGFLNVLSDSPKPEAAMNELGKRYFFLENSYKPYASCRLTHPVINSVKQLRVDIAPQDVVSIDLFLGPLCLDAAGIKTPRTGLEAKFSVFHCAALALVQGDASAAHFNDDQVMDPLLVDLREKVRVTPVEGMKDGEARVVVTTKDGRTLEAHVSAPKGDPVNPMSFDDLVEKFKLLSGTVLSGEKVNRIVEMVEGMDDVEDVGQLVRYCHV